VSACRKLFGEFVVRRTAIALRVLLADCFKSFRVALNLHVHLVDVFELLFHADPEFTVEVLLLFQCLFIERRLELRVHSGTFIISKPPSGHSFELGSGINTVATHLEQEF